MDGTTWRSVVDDPPPKRTPVLVFGTEYPLEEWARMGMPYEQTAGIYVGELSDVCWILCGVEGWDYINEWPAVTHWMPLPNPPKTPPDHQ